MMEKADTKDKKIQNGKSYFLLLTSYFSLKKGQVMIEFVFCMIILFLMMYGAIMVFRWVGLDLGQRQQAHEAVLTSEIDFTYGQCAGSDLWGICVGGEVPVERGPLTQIDPYFYQPGSMNAVWSGD